MSSKAIEGKPAPQKTDGRARARPSLAFSCEKRRSFSRDLVVHAFDVPVHAQDLAGIEVIAALAFHRLAVLIGDRALERMQRAGFEAYKPSGPQST